jgi:3D (Asp-Asp-Asp) domain-containing protein
MRAFRKHFTAFLAALIVLATRTPLLHIMSSSNSSPAARETIAAEASVAALAGARLGKPEERPKPKIAAIAPASHEREMESPSRPPAPTVSRSGRRLTVTATAYTSHEGGSVTYTGAHVTPWHTLSVDPTEIPLGSWVFIPYFEDKPNKGWFHAEDIGSAIKANRIDVYFEDLDDALNFGRRDLEILVSDTPPAT